MKKGFTLIELLAVIVILSIIALISVLLLGDTILNAKEDANKISISNYVTAIEKQIYELELEDVIVSPGTYQINSEGNLELGRSVIEIDFDGSKPTSGTVVINNNMSVQSITAVINGEKITK